MSDPIIGIDLGTTNSEVAVVEEGQVKLIEDANTRILPSVVGLDDNGAVLVGEAARNQALLHPERTVGSVKRLMGMDQALTLGDTSYRPQEISAMILKKLKHMAERYLGRAVSQAVITVPAYFSDAQRQATREAGEIAGLEVVRMINEPTAATLAYERDEKTQKRALVYDLGGGTFDVSVVEIQGNVVEVLASHGNNHLGGDDFDQAIVDRLTRHLADQGVHIGDDSATIARLRRAAEAAKVRLSNHPFARIEEEYIAVRDGEPYHLSYELARDDYEALIAPYIDETLEAIHTALDGANLASSAIDEVLLVGGSTRTPAIQHRLADIFKAQPRGEIDPDLCVATGAAIQAAVIGGETVASVLVDVTPYTFGTSAVALRDNELYEYAFVPLIEKNTALPTTKSEVFYTLQEGQESVEVNIYQGEDPDALNNIAIGRFKVEGLSGKLPENNPIVLTLSLDLNGLLTVTALEKNTGLNKSITIERAMAELDDNTIDESRARVTQLFGEDGEIIDIDAADGDSQKQRHWVTQARALVEKAQRLQDKAEGEDREDLAELIEAIDDAIAQSQYDALQEAKDDLSDLIYYLEA